MNLRRDILEGWVRRASAPFLGVPILYADGGRTTAVFRRDMLKAAASCPYIRKVTWNADTRTLTLNGGHRACYVLRDLNTNRENGWNPGLIAEELRAWAAARRRRRAPRRSREAVRLQRIAERVGKLRKQRERMFLRPPSNPCLRRGEQAGEYERARWTAWTAEGPARRRLATVVGGKLRHGEPRTWAAFYRACGLAMGRRIDPGQRHARVCARRNGPTREDYLKNMPDWIGMAGKPYERGKPWNPFAPYEYGEEHGLNDFQRHRRAQLAYLLVVRERQELEEQLAAFEAEIAEARDPKL